MKKNVLFLACFSASLVACDSASVVNPLALVDTGNTDASSDDSTGTDGPALDNTDASSDGSTGTDSPALDNTDASGDGSTGTDGLAIDNTDASSDGRTGTDGLVITGNTGTSTGTGTVAGTGTDIGTGTITGADGSSDADSDIGTIGGTDSDGTTTGMNSGTGTAGSGTGLDGVTNSRTANGIVNSVGLIKLEPIGVTVDNTRGLFGDLPQPRADQEIRDWYMPPADSCNITFLNSQIINPDDFIVRDQVANLVSAGDSLVLTDVNGTFATLQQFNGPVGPEYQPESEINQSAGADLSVDIPGDNFTGFANIAVPPVPALNFSAPAVGSNVTTSTFFQWQSSNVPGSVVEIFTSGVSTATNEEIFIACSLVDDGSFTFPADIQARMGANFDDFFTSALRIVYNVAAEDDTLVFIANSVRSNLNIN